MKLHHIRLADELQAIRPEHDSVDGPHAGRRPDFDPCMGPLVRVGAFERMHILHPHVLNPMHRTPPLAEQQIVQGADGLEIIVRNGRRR